MKHLPAQSKTVAIPATDGLLLTGNVHEPSQPAAATVLALPGVGVPQRVFRHIAPWFAARGLRVLSIDYRGMFGSGGQLGERSASMTRWATRDAVGALRYAERTFGDPVVLLAHSYGGQMLGLHDDFRRVRGVVTVGSGFGNPSYFSGRTRLFVTASWYLTLPLCAALLGRVPRWAGLGVPLPAGVGREWARWGRSPDWLLSHAEGARARFGRFDRPTLMLRAAHDDICSAPASDALRAQLRTAPLRYREVSPAELGGRARAHVSVFHAAAAGTIWPEILAHVQRCLADARERAA